MDPEASGSSFGLFTVIIIVIIIIIIVVVVYLFFGSGQRFVVHPINWTIVNGVAGGTGAFTANSNHIYIVPSGATATSTVTVSPGDATQILINTNNSLVQFGTGSLFILDNTKSTTPLNVTGTFTSGTAPPSSSPGVVAPGTSGTYIWDSITSFHRLS